MATINTDGSIVISNIDDFSDSILIYNNSNIDFVSGIGGSILGRNVPFSGFLSNQGSTIAISPINKLFVFFATSVYDLSAILSTSLASSACIDFVDNISRTINYDDSKGGWVKNNLPWMIIYPPGIPLNPILIEEPRHNTPMT